MLNSEALQLVYQALWLVLMLSAPPVLAAAVVGLLIALVQAATQIQEQTLQYALKFFTIVHKQIFRFPQDRNSFLKNYRLFALQA